MQQILTLIYVKREQYCGKYERRCWQKGPVLRRIDGDVKLSRPLFQIYVFNTDVAEHSSAFEEGEHDFQMCPSRDVMLIQNSST